MDDELVFATTRVVRGRPWELTFAEFIGPHIVSPVFAIDGRDEQYDAIWETAEEPDLPALWRSKCGTYSIHDLEFDEGPAIVLCATQKGERSAIGFYFRGQSWVDEAWRGRGLGSALVLAAANLTGGPPTGIPGGMGFSEAGVAVHRKAHRFAVERAVAAGMDVPERVRTEYGLEQTTTRRP